VAQRLHLVFGEELTNPVGNVFGNVDDIDIVGIFPNHQSAYDAWKRPVWRMEDDAHAGSFIAP